MCRISGTWFNSSTVNITVEEFCQHRKKKISCPWLLNNRASDCWTIVPATVEQSYQWLLNNPASDCWRIVLATAEESCQWLLNNHASDCWTIVPVTKNVRELSSLTFLQWLLNSLAIEYSTFVLVTVEELYQRLLKNCPRDCWRIMPVTVEKLCQWLLTNRANGCWTVVPAFFSLFLTYFGKILTSFSCKYFN